MSTSKPGTFVCEFQITVRIAPPHDPSSVEDEQCFNAKDLVPNPDTKVYKIKYRDLGQSSPCSHLRTYYQDCWAGGLVCYNESCYVLCITGGERRTKKWNGDVKQCSKPFYCNEDSDRVYFVCIEGCTEVDKDGEAKREQSGDT